MTVLRRFYCDNLSVCIYASRQQMGKAAAEYAVKCLEQELSQKAEVNMMFAAAPSQNEVLAELRARKDLAWERVNAFHMDEYVALDAAHPAGFRNFLHRALFDHLPFKNVRLLDGNASDPDAEACEYDALLRRYPLDICIMGVGENGHIAFNDPPVADFNDPLFVKVVELDQNCRLQQINDGCFEKLQDVPTKALSVTVPGLMQAKHIVCSVPTATKAKAIFEMLTGEISTSCPASILREHPDAKLYLDRNAGKFVL